ncbi:hypothetical protein H7F15_03425 [Pontibacter sp. Tf4]|uniref:hypothetical protein n=1 Tax=Pontibacter sp. Tf4 TaxID=2761620 RepID=UPI001627480E|nr:hypothetical protein [Pontibacter sp. Tf4]MBB6610078.1 hypothetical protein [Pontibacter sp. Tf4]
MEQENLNEWNEERYRELNSYFRVRIQVLVDSDPYIRDMVQQGKSLQLNDLISQLSEDDQELWHEFIRLDAIKLHHDMQNHLEGRGTPYNPRDGFSSTTDDDDEDVPPVW